MQRMLIMGYEVSGDEATRSMNIVQFSSFSGRALSVFALFLVSLILATTPKAAESAPVQVCDSSSLDDAVSGAAPGSEIVMCDGTWRDVAVRLTADGTASAPIRLRAQTPGKVILTGASSLRLGGSYIEVNGLTFKGPTVSTSSYAHPVAFYVGSSNCRNCSLLNSAIIDYNYADVTTHRAWVVVRGQKNRIENNYFVGKSTLGAIVDVQRASGVVDEHRISRNYFSRLKSPETNFGEAVKVGQGVEDSLDASRVIIEENYFYHSDGEIEMISLKASENVVRRNTVDSSLGTISLRQGRANRVDSNVIFGRGIAGTGGIRLSGSDHVIINNYIDGIRPPNNAYGGISLFSGDGGANYFQVKDALVAFNTIVNSEMSLVFGSGDRSEAPLRVKLANNVVMTTLDSIVNERMTLLDPVVTGNIFFGNKLGATLTSGYTMVNPSLKADAFGIMRPAPLSPVLAHAKSTFGITMDRDGNLRASTASDAGADEVSSGGNPLPPIEACDVGPLTWAAGNCSVSTRPMPPSSIIVD